LSERNLSVLIKEMKMNDPSLEKIKGDILIVDDDAASLQTLSAILLEQGFGVRRARDAKTALMIIHNAPPDLIFLDVRMPGMDGFELCKELKASENSCEIPVLFLSAANEINEKVKGFETGAVDYITKPFQVEEVVARAQTHLDSNRLRHQLEIKNQKLKSVFEEQKRTQLALERSNEELENRVIARTSKLNKANTRLKEEIEERKLRETELRHTEEELSTQLQNLKNALSEIEQLKNRIENENIHLRQEIKLKYKHKELVGRSKGIKKVLAQVEKVAAQNTCVLITGETGTGKELVAQAIHNLSPRKNRVMIKVNCAALPAPLIESELFGREKGAYTGALTRQSGRFEVAHESTIFLDEIGDLPSEIQVKLLRVLQEGKFERLGSTKTTESNARIIAATNRNLPEAVKNGTFRNDLYYRLNVFPIAVPPLRERRDDIPLLTWFFVKEFENSMGKKIDSISKHTMNNLQQYSWPGNIRELKNTIERAVILCEGPHLTINEIESQPSPIADEKLEDVTRNHILRILKKTKWRAGGKNGAAEILGLKRTTLLTKMKKLNIKPPHKR
jgi:DNA-binding NtrC family response regulator